MNEFTLANGTVIPKTTDVHHHYYRWLGAQGGVSECAVTEYVVDYMTLLILDPIKNDSDCEAATQVGRTYLFSIAKHYLANGFTLITATETTVSLARKAY